MCILYFCKVDGKTLCLLCTMEYKKAKHREMKRQKDSNEGKMCVVCGVRVVCGVCVVCVMWGVLGCISLCVGVQTCLCVCHEWERVTCNCN